MDLAHRVAKRAADTALVKVALECLQSLPDELRDEVESFMHGVFTGKAQALEQYADALYDAYAPARELLQSRHGSTVTAYRGEPQDRPAITRRFLSWTPVYGGRVLSVKVDEENERVVLGVLLPANTPTENGDAKLGPYVVEALRAYSRVSGPFSQG